MDIDDDLDYPVDDKDLEVDVNDSDQATVLVSNIDPDNQDALHDGDRDLIHNSTARDAPPSISVAHFPMPVTVSEIISVQKTGEFCQTVFARMRNTN